MLNRSTPPKLPIAFSKLPKLSKPAQISPNIRFCKKKSTVELYEKTLATVYFCQFTSVFFIPDL